MTKETKDKIENYQNFELGRDAILNYLKSIQIIGTKTFTAWAKYTKASSFIAAISPYIYESWQEEGILKTLDQLDLTLKQKTFENTIPTLKVGSIVSYYKRAEENITDKADKKYIYRIDSICAKALDTDNVYIILSPLDSEADKYIITKDKASEKTNISSHPYIIMPFKSK